MKQKLLSLKNLLFKPAVSAIVFISFILIGGLIIVARQSNPTALDNLKAGANNNMLTATNWDALIDYVKGLEGDIYTKIIDIQTQATNLWNKDGNNIYYNSGSVSIGNNVSIGGSIKIGNTTDSCSSSNAGSMKYANGCMSYCNSTERKEISCPVVCTISPTFTYVGQNFVITDCTATYTIADRNVWATVSGTGTNSYGNYYTYSQALSVCPNGYHLPSPEEWEWVIVIGINAGWWIWEGNDSALEFTKQLKLPLPGFIYGYSYASSNGTNPNGTERYGYYRTSQMKGNTDKNYTLGLFWGSSLWIHFGSEWDNWAHNEGTPAGNWNTEHRFPVRCFKN